MPSEIQTNRPSHVPTALAQLFERPKSEQPLDVFQPADWPPCPDCDGRLMATAVVTDAQDALVAATMTCYNRDHASKRYVYDVRTGDLYFESGPCRKAAHSAGGVRACVSAAIVRRSGQTQVRRSHRDA